MFEPYLDIPALAASLVPKARRCVFPRAGEREPWEALAPEARKELLSWGEEALEGYPMLTATQFLAFVRTGDRQAYEQPYFQRRHRLMGAVLAECARHDGAFLDAVADGLWCICEESSWVISAHNGSSHEGMRPPGQRPLPDVENPYIDLFAAQTAATLCYALYLLGDELNALSPLIGRRVRLELEKRIFLPFFTRDDFWWMGMIRKDLNNWTPWILSNLMDAMLLTLEDDNRLAEGLSRAMEMLDRYLDTVPPDGGCDEGCAYWNMAGASLLDCLESLHTATGGAIDLFGEPLVQAMGCFPLQAHIEGPWFWNFADCDAKPRLDGESLYRYGRRTGNRALEALGARIAGERTSLRSTDTPQMNRVLWTLGISSPFSGGISGASGTSSLSSGASSSPSWVALPHLQVYAWRGNGWYGALKGGHNGESHNHNDVGSFILYLDGHPQIVDAGNLVYTAQTFGPRRYELWNTRSGNHNLPLIGQAEQREGRRYAAQVLEADEAGAALELAGAYPPEAGLASFTRRFSLTESGPVLTDRLELAQGQSQPEPLPVTWIFLLANEPRWDPAANLLRAGPMALQVPPGARYEALTMPITDRRMARCFQTLWRVAFTYGPQAIYHMTFAVTRS